MPRNLLRTRKRVRHRIDGLEKKPQWRDRNGTVRHRIDGLEKALDRRYDALTVRHRIDGLETYKPTFRIW